MTLSNIVNRLLVEIALFTCGRIDEKRFFICETSNDVGCTISFLPILVDDEEVVDSVAIVEDTTSCFPCTHYDRFSKIFDTLRNNKKMLRCGDIVLCETSSRTLAGLSVPKGLIGLVIDSIGMKPYFVAREIMETLLRFGGCGEEGSRCSDRVVVSKPVVDWVRMYISFLNTVFHNACIITKDDIVCGRDLCLEELLYVRLSKILTENGCAKTFVNSKTLETFFVAQRRDDHIVVVWSSDAEKTLAFYTRNVLVIDLSTKRR